MNTITSFIATHLLECLALFISIIALLFSLLKDFILPLIQKPKLRFTYNDKEPYRRFTTSHTRSCFLRISVRNFGKSPALNCRCQILRVKKDGNNYGDYMGFPSRWAGKPEEDTNSLSRERLNIGRGETEFIDIATANYCDDNIHLLQYHKEGIGIKTFIEAGKYDIILVVSGDNFNPYILFFSINKENTNNPNSLKGVALKEIKGYTKKKILEEK